MEQAACIDRHNAGRIDAMKFICAILVVVIHTSPFEPISPVLNFYVIGIVCRIAVPFFFAAAGFYFFGKSLSKMEKSSAVPRTGSAC